MNVLGFVLGVVVGAAVTRQMTRPITREDADRFWGIRSSTEELEEGEREVDEYDWLALPDDEPT